MKTVFAWLFVSITLIGCDIRLRAHGYVFDKVTKKSIDSVIVRLEEKEEMGNRTYSEKDGSFEYSFITGGTNSFHLYFSKNGYLTKEIKFITDDNRIDTVYLEKIVNQK
ncbi:MAG TPA: hypothetical protein VK783_08660 [Bacteroidia bacterium]|jgi:hypothetical protein|nr:hypothetical protein [Bacteroidia bacterium]